MKVKQGKSAIWLFLKINISITISMKRSRRELSIDMVIHVYLKKISSSPVLPSYLMLPKAAVNFYCVIFNLT